ncbi:MAG: glutathione transferase GstA [bacterium]
MRLYYSPGACSLSPHIVAREAGLPVELDKVDFNDGRKTEDGSTLGEVNPKGYIPALRLDDGPVLTEGVAIVQYLADQAPEKKLMPERGTTDYYRALEWLTFISSELHKGFSPLYNPAIAEDAKKAAIEKIGKRVSYVEGMLAGKQYLLGDSFMIPDAYLYTILRWAKRFEIDLSVYPNVTAFMERMRARPGVSAALAEEGLE